MRFSETQAQATRRLLATVADGVDAGKVRLSVGALYGFDRDQLRVALAELEACGACEPVTRHSWAFSVQGVRVVARVAGTADLAA